MPKFSDMVKFRPERKNGPVIVHKPEESNPADRFGDRRAQPSKYGFKREDVVDYIEQHPGVTARQLTKAFLPEMEYVEAVNVMSGKLYTWSNAKAPGFVRRKFNGVWNYYPASYRIPGTAKLPNQPAPVDPSRGGRVSQREQVIFYIKQNPGLSLGEIAKGLPHIPKGSISSVLTYTTTEGIVERDKVGNYRLVTPDNAPLVTPEEKLAQAIVGELPKAPVAYGDGPTLITDYLKQHPGATFPEIRQAVGMPPSSVSSFLGRGRHKGEIVNRDHRYWLKEDFDSALRDQPTAIPYEDKPPVIVPEPAPRVDDRIDWLEQEAMKYAWDSDDINKLDRDALKRFINYLKGENHAN